jgi:hypothetical protein
MGKRDRESGRESHCYLPTLKDNICSFGSVLQENKICSWHTYIILPGRHNLIFGNSRSTSTLDVCNWCVSHHLPGHIGNGAVPGGGKNVSKVRPAVRKDGLLLDKHAIPKHGIRTGRA